MKQTLLLLCCLLTVTVLSAQLFTTVQDGPWNSASTWQGGNIPKLTTFQNPNPYTVTIKHNVTFDGNIRISGNSVLIIEEEATLTVDGNVKIDGGSQVSLALDNRGILICDNYLHSSSNGSSTHTGLLIADQVRVSNGTLNLNGEVETDELIASNSGTLNCNNADIEVNGDVEVSGSGSATFTNTNIVADDFEVKGSGELDWSGGTLDVEETITIKGSGSVDMVDVDVSAEDMQIQGSGSIDLSGGETTIANDLTATGSGSVNVDGATLVVGATIELKGSGNLNLTGRGRVAASTIRLRGSGSFVGSGDGGIVSFDTWDGESSSTQFSCPGDSFDDNNPPTSPVDLATCTDASALLPVEWLFFTAQTEGLTIQLKWATATESGNAYFAIERSSNNGISWEEIGRVSGSGDRQDPMAYQFRDQWPPAVQTVFYRLRQVDFDGQFAFSTIVAVQTTEENTLAAPRIYPNPARDFVSVQLAPGVEILGARLINSVGQVVRLSVSAPQSMPLPAYLPAGIYTLELQSATHTYRLPLLIAP